MKFQKLTSTRESDLENKRSIQTAEQSTKTLVSLNDQPAKYGELLTRNISSSTNLERQKIVVIYTQFKGDPS